MLSVKVVGCGLGNRGIVVPIAARFRDFSLPQSVQTDPWSHLTSYSPGASTAFSGARWPGRDADHSPPCSAEVTNERSYASSHSYAFTAFSETLLLPKALHISSFLYVTSLHICGNFSACLPRWHVVSSDKLSSIALFAIYWYWATGSEFISVIN